MNCPGPGGSDYWIPTRDWPVEWEHPPEASLVREPRSQMVFSCTPAQFETGCAQIGQHPMRCCATWARTAEQTVGLGG